jgi:uncharacterized membrane protein YfcA
MKVMLLAGLTVWVVGYIIMWSSLAKRGSETDSPASGNEKKGREFVLYAGTGAVTNFFDTLGIGSFATTMSIYKFSRLVPDELLPGTLNVGHALPAMMQAFIYITIVKVQPLTLLTMIAAAVLGMWFGSGIVSGLKRRAIQVGMGLALIAGAVALLMGQIKLFPIGGAELGIQGFRLVTAVVLNFAFGALQALGIGLYAPCMILVSLLGMSPRAAFPIMMGSCAFMMPVGGIRFIRGGAYHLRAAVGLALGGIPGVLAAVFLVRSLSLSALRWMVITVVVYAAIVMLRSAKVGKDHVQNRRTERP